MSHKPQPHLLLHNIIGSLSYWGTTTRMLLAGFVLGMAVLVHITDAMSLSATTSYAHAYFYTMACLFLLDAGYVTIARSVPAKYPRLDALTLLFTLIVLSVIAVAPYFVEVTSTVFHSISVWLFAVVLFLLSVRLVLGVLSQRK